MTKQDSVFLLGKYGIQFESNAMEAGGSDFTGAASPLWYLVPMLQWLSQRLNPVLKIKGSPLAQNWELHASGELMLSAWHC